jgi:hypothetical protein
MGKDTDLASHGRYRVQIILDDLVGNLRWLAVEKALTEGDKAKFAEALKHAEACRQLVEKTRFKDSRSVKWLKKEARKR